MRPTIIDYHPEEAVLVDADVTACLRHRDILHYWEKPFVYHTISYPGGWYFHDEAGDLYGPYDTAADANYAAEQYIRSLG